MNPWGGFELRLADRIGDMRVIAWAIASSPLKGPVYLSLPHGATVRNFAVDEAALQAGFRSSRRSLLRQSGRSPAQPRGNRFARHP